MRNTIHKIYHRVLEMDDGCPREAGTTYLWSRTVEKIMNLSGITNRTK